MGSKVYFTSFRTVPGTSYLTKLRRLLKAAGIETIDFEKKFTAIKIHFGQPGNMAYLRPNYANTVVQYLKELGAKVYLTDSATLYSGARDNAVDHLVAASENGYNLLQVGAPVIIADGVKGMDYAEMPVVGGEECKSAKIGRALADADIVISLSHFKGHEQAGFGGTLKNLGMGGASIEGKMFLHCNGKPVVSEDLCRGCKMCERDCNHDAIHVGEDRKAHIDYSKCLGCGQCIAICAHGACGAPNDASSAIMNRRIAEYTKAILDGKPSFHITLIMDVSPECDCWGSNDAAVVPNVGMACSFDPVALDQACADLVLAAPRIDNSAFGDKPHVHEHGNDIFKHIHPDTDWQSGLEHGEKIGLGTRSYELVRLG